MAGVKQPTALAQAICDAKCTIPKVQSLVAIAGRAAAEKLTHFVENQLEAATAFESDVLVQLDKAFLVPQRDGRNHGVTAPKTSAAREKMWTRYHTIRNSPVFVALWNAFLKSAGVTSEDSGAVAVTLLFQTISDKLFEKRIRLHCPVRSSASESETTSTSLSYEEENALRYAAGYVLKNVKKHVASSGASNRALIIETIDSLAVNADIDDDVSSDWIKLVDRGGLVHISDDLFFVFEAVELEIRKYFNVKIANSSVSCDIVSSVLSSNGVQFYWSMVSTTIAEDISEELLKLLVSQWITIRGHSFARSFVEIYKQQNKKHIQKSKSLRKKLSDK